ncbi:hypothetical protein [Lysobacter sp. CA199]|uniref:hypothetical protein n=1 Tax=Lysobacter sp. CA199 TaxID=3455608 RepID=UPI003F8D6719
MKRNALKWSIAAAALALGGVFSLSSSALPYPPDNTWVVVTWSSNGIAHGQTHYGNCPPGSPYPLDWGYAGGTPTISYLVLRQHRVSRRVLTRRARARRLRGESTMKQFLHDACVRRAAFAASLLALTLFASVGSAGPVIPDGKLLITTFWQEGEAVGGDVQGVCPPGAPMPLPWGIRSSQKTYSYMNCAAP